MSKSLLNEVSTHVFEKTKSVLWAPTPEGVILHNFESDSYIQLGRNLCKAWEYLDGSQTLDQVWETLEAESDSLSLTEYQDFVGDLIDHGFIQEVGNEF